VVDSEGQPHYNLSSSFSKSYGPIEKLTFFSTFLLSGIKNSLLRESVSGLVLLKESSLM
jgi:hypothetical protein